MAICRGDVVVYIPACDTWALGDASKQAEFWVDCAQHSLFGHFQQKCALTSDFETWGDMLFQDDHVLAHKMLMGELKACKGKDVAVLLIFDEQGKIADKSESNILSDALPNAQVASLYALVLAFPSLKCLFLMRPGLGFWLPHCHHLGLQQVVA